MSPELTIKCLNGTTDEPPSLWDCPECNGTGEVVHQPDDGGEFDPFDSEACPICDGEGYVVARHRDYRPNLDAWRELLAESEVEA